MPDRGYEPDHDPVLGRAFDRRLTARLWAAARPHHRLVAGALALFPPIAAAELAQPYLLKVAIDDHILARDWAGLGVVAGLYALVLGVLYALRNAEALGLPGAELAAKVDARLRELPHGCSGTRTTARIH